jgi:NADH-quinone oxidoreductase subunit N
VTLQYYGVTGSLDLGEISSAVEGKGNQLILIFGLVFLMVGVAFKLGAVPFHMWVPDVYHGAPTAVTLYISTAPKLAAFAMMMRLLVDGLGGLQAQWHDILMLLAVLSLAIGNVVAIAQTNIKRMLAYSGISHVGFLLLGVLSGTQEGYAAGAAPGLP